jgi:hypothetical protein
MTLDILDDDGQIAPPRRKVGRPKKSAHRTPFVAPSSKPEPPTESWWTVPMTREQFSAKAAERFPDMQASKYGKQAAPTSEAFS